MNYRYEVIKKGEKSTAGAVASGEAFNVLVEDKNLITGCADMFEALGELSSVEQDILTLSSSILAADRASKRGEREEFNRHISLEISLHNAALLYPTISKLIKILRYLSNDAWSISLRQSTVDPAWGDLRDQELQNTAKSDGKILLFSGGLDSLAGAVDFGAKGPLSLVSHVTKNRITDKAQQDLVKILKRKKLIVDHTQIFVSSRNGGATDFEHDVEPSQRTRSIVFIALGAIIARRKGMKKIVLMSENGQMAIHLPLSGGRIGAFSTHTAHPTVLSRCSDYFSSVLGVKIDLLNPYVYETKGEVVSRVMKVIPSSVKIATSCWKNARVAKDGINHCGECVPCLVRRIAIESNGSDITAYKRNLLSEDIKNLKEDDDGRRNFTDIAEFVVRFSRQSESELLSEFPDLICEDFDSKKAIEMYKRFSSEARRVLSGYSQLKPFIN